VSNTPWNPSRGDYTAQQWARACLIDTEQGSADSKDRYKLPYRDPSGAVNRTGVQDAVASINHLEGVSTEKRAAAARTLVAVYRNELKEDPPEGLSSMGERAAPETERLWTNVFTGADGSPLQVRNLNGASGKGLVIGGYAAMYSKRSHNLGGFQEIVESSFFNKSAADGWPGVICRYNHNDMMLLGTTASGTLKLSRDNIGLDYTVKLPECRGDVYEMVDRQDVRNSSFAFQVYEQEWAYEDGIALRHLVSGRLIDVSPVASPAYPDATVGLRSLSELKHVPLEEIRTLAKNDELKKLFVRTDVNGKVEALQPSFGPAVRMKLLEKKHPNIKAG